MELLWLWLILGAAGLVILCALFVWFNNSFLKTTRYKIHLEGIEGRRILHLSDLHGKTFSKHNAALIKKAAEAKPDFIAITGDIIHIYTPKNISVALETVSALKEVAPVLFIAGNHEMRNKGYRFLRKGLIEAGATVLDDRTVEVCGISVTGLNGASLRNQKINTIDKGKAQILLAHEPQFLKKYADAGFRLVLCGHAHGGQWRIPFTGIGLYAPGQGKFPKYTSGLHTDGDCKMIISRGLGNSEFPLRLFNRPEIVIIDLI